MKRAIVLTLLLGLPLFLCAARCCERQETSPTLQLSVFPNEHLSLGVAMFVCADILDEAAIDLDAMTSVTLIVRRRSRPRAYPFVVSTQDRRVLGPAQEYRDYKWPQVFPDDGPTLDVLLVEPRVKFKELFLVTNVDESALASDATQVGQSIRSLCRRLGSDRYP